MRFLPLIIIIAACAPVPSPGTSNSPDYRQIKKYQQHRDFVNRHNRRFDAIRQHQRSRKQ